MVGILNDDKNLIKIISVLQFAQQKCNIYARHYSKCKIADYNKKLQMEECVHRTWMPPLQLKENRSITTELKRWSSLKLNLA